MRVDLVKPIGHCYGVINAIELAKKVANTHKDKNIYIFGFLVHNDDVIEELESLNIKTVDITDVDPLKKLEEFNKDDIVIFTAHGHPYSYEEVLNKRGVKYYDASCPKVLQSFELIKKANETIYIGKNNHPETKAALTMSNNVHLYDINNGLDYQVVKSESPLVLNQTTLSFLELKDIHQDIKEHFPKAQIIDEICNATLLRQKAIQELNDDVDLIVIAGSKRSSNTNKLYEVASSSHPLKKVIFVENKEDLMSTSLNYKHAVIAGGTSTPITIIREIKEYLERL